MPPIRGNSARYEVEIETEDGRDMKAYILVATYDELKASFEQPEDFKTFLFQLQSYAFRDTFDFFRQFYHINYPPYPNREEPLMVVLPKDRFQLARRDIKKLSFLSYTKTSFGGLTTELTLEEVGLLRTPPVYYQAYPLAPSMVEYTRVWLLSYNPAFNKKELDEQAASFQKEFAERTNNTDRYEQSWVFRDMMNEWQPRLKEEDVFLLEVVAP
jgi:hypothetical protein